MMTATTPTTGIGARRGYATVEQLRRSARVAAALLANVGSRWNDIVDAGQLGPSAETMISRRTGGRI